MMWMMAANYLGNSHHIFIFYAIVGSTASACHSMLIQLQVADLHKYLHRCFYFFKSLAVQNRVLVMMKKKVKRKSAQLIIIYNKRST